MLYRVLKFLPSKKDYDLRFFREDLLAGLTVAVVALPLALAFGVTSGAGAAAGLYTAIVAGVVAAVFGGSNFQVSGPTGAMTVVLLPIVADYGVSSLIFVGLLAGLLLIALAFFGLGKLVSYIPWPVIVGFTSGIGVIIFLQQVPGFLGVAVDPGGDGAVPAALESVRRYLEAADYAAPVLTLLTIAVMLAWGRVKTLRALPASMAALIAATLTSLLPVFSGVPRIGAIPSGLPIPILPQFPGAADLSDLARAALAVALLAALESLLSATVADGMTVGQRHDPNRELFGQGLANIAAAMFGGVPATAALARTAINVRSGARTRLAAAIHGLTLLVIVLFLGGLAAQVPLAVLAGILMVVALRMVEVDAIRVILRATKSDAFVLVLSLVVTVAFDLILAIEVGLAAAAALFVIRMSSSFTTRTETLRNGSSAHDEERDAVPNAVIYRVDGPIFFGAANRFLDHMLKIDRNITFVVLRMRNVPVMDASGGSALEAFLEHLERFGIRLLVSNLQPQPRALLMRTGLLERLDGNGHRLFGSTQEALAYVRASTEDRESKRAEPEKPTAG